MTARLRSSSTRVDATSLTDAPLCASEAYYEQLASPLFRTRRQVTLRAAFATFIPPALLAFFSGGALALLWALGPRLRGTSFPAWFVALFSGPSLAPAALIAAALAVMFVALLSLSVWARRDLARERRVRAALDASLRLARAYRTYLERLALFTAPMQWLRAAAEAKEGAAAVPALILAPLISDGPSVAHTESDLEDTDSVSPGDFRVATGQGWVSGVGMFGRPESAHSARDVTQALNTTVSGAIVVTGASGAGKSTLLSHTARAHALARLRDTAPDGRAPLYIDLSLIDSSALPDFVSLVARSIQVVAGVEPDIAVELARKFVFGPSLLVFDELDSLSSDARDNVVGLTSAFLASRKGAAQAPAETAPGERWDVQVALAARTYHLPSGDGPLFSRLRHWRVAPLTARSLQLTLIQRTLAIFGAPVTQEDASPEQGVFDLLAASPLTSEWLTSPLMLTLAAVAVANNPGRARFMSHTELYAAVVQALLDWHAAEPGDDDGKSRAALLRAAEDLALELTARGVRVFSPEPGDPATSGAASSEVVTALQALVAIPGLCQTLPGGGVSFTHASVQAWFAGRALARWLKADFPEPIATFALAIRRKDTSTEHADQASHQESSRWSHFGRPGEDAFKLIWSRRGAASWREPLAFMCGALVERPTRQDDERRDIARPDLANAWLGSVLARARAGQEALPEPWATEVAATGLREMGTDPSGAELAGRLARLLAPPLLRDTTRMSPDARATLRRACVALVSTAAGRRALLDELVGKLASEESETVSLARDEIMGASDLTAASTQWLSNDPSLGVWVDRTAIVDALGTLGLAIAHESIPIMLELLITAEVATRLAAIDALSVVVSARPHPIVQALARCLADPEDVVRMSAAYALGRTSQETTATLGVSGAALALEPLLRDASERVQTAAAWALNALDAVDEAQVAALIERLNERDAEMRLIAIRTLSALESYATPAAPALLICAQDESAHTRAEAIRALSHIAPGLPAVARVIAERLRDPSPEPRWAAAQALSHDAAGDAGDVEPVLLNLLRDQRGYVRLAAAQALLRRDVANDPARRDALFEMLDDPRGYIRAVAARSLSTLDVDSVRLLPERIASLSDVRDDIRLAAMAMVGMFGALARDAMPQLVALLRDSSWRVRVAALRAMARVGPAAGDIPQIAKLLSDEDQAARLAAAETLGALKPDLAALALEPLARRLQDDPDSAVRAAAARAIGQIGPAALSKLSVLTKRLHDPVFETQRAVAMAIGALQPPLDTITAPLLDWLGTPSADDAGIPALACGALGPRAASVVAQEVLFALNDARPTTRALAAEALGLLGPVAGEPAIDALLYALSDWHQDVCVAAVRSLGAVAPESLDVSQAIAERLSDERPAVRRAVVETLARLGTQALAEATPTILEMLREGDVLDREVALRAIAALAPAQQAEIGANAIALMAEVHPHVAAAAAQALAVVGSALSQAQITRGLQAAQPLLTSHHAVVRAAAVTALAALDGAQQDDLVIGLLREALYDSDWMVRAAAVEALGVAGVWAQVAYLPELGVTLSDEDDSVRQKAAGALAREQPEAAKELMPVLVRALANARADSPLAHVAQRRELAMYRYFQEPSWAVCERVTALLEPGTHWSMQRDAVSLLRRWRRAPMSARRGLVTLWRQSPAPVCRESAYAALQAILADDPAFDDLEDVALGE